MPAAGRRRRPDEPRRKHSRRRVEALARFARFCLWFGGVILIIGVGTSLYSVRNGHAASSSGSKLGDAARPMPVVAVPAERGAMPIYLNALGTVIAQNAVTVRSRVDGQLMRIHFREGQTVNSGDVLADIDPRPFQLQLAQAEGQLARDYALLRSAATDLERYRTLHAQDSIEAQKVDAQNSLVEQYRGAVKVDQSQVDNAKLQLAYARVTAPVAGRLGLRQVDPGNMIHASDASGLVVITQLRPIYVVFSVPQEHISTIVSRLRTGASIAVEAYDNARRLKVADGTLLTIDNQIDTATGTIKLKAEFPNSNEALFPNQFVTVRLLVDTKQEVVIIPQAAIQRGSVETFVYAVNVDKTVEIRRVSLGPADGERVAIASGLRSGDLVVVDGADNLRAGTHVQLVKKRGDGERSKARRDKHLDDPQASLSDTTYQAAR
jgi:multidrug efflux system membrane fusion protein